MLIALISPTFHAVRFNFWLVYLTYIHTAVVDSIGGRMMAPKTANNSDVVSYSNVMHIHVRAQSDVKPFKYIFITVRMILVKWFLILNNALETKL